MHPKFFHLFLRTGITQFILIILLVFITGCGRNQKTEFDKLTDAFVQWYFKSWPVAATQTGFHSHDAEFGKYDKDSETEILADLKRFNIELSQIDPAILPENDQIDYQILSHSINGLIFDIVKVKKIQWSPQFVPSIIGGGLYSLIEREFAPMEVRVQALESRLSQVPRVVSELQNLLVEAPEIYVETAIKQTDGLIGSIIDIPLEIRTDNSTFDRIENHISAAVKSLTQYRDWLQNGPLQNHPRDFRLGETLFREKFKYAVTESMTPEVLFEQAQSSLISTQDEMFRLALPEYLSKNDEPVWVTRSDTLNVVKWVLDRIAVKHVGRDKVVQNVRDTIDELTQFIQAHHIVTLDDSRPLIIREMPAYMQGVSVANLDAPGALEKNQAVYYNVSPIPEDWASTKVESFLREYNDISVKMLSIHEALPGHYVQLSYAQREPSVIRAIFENGSMIEGWAHYAEGMMINAGFGNGDPNYEIVQKKWALRGIINAIIDQQIHAGSMSKDEVIKFMVEQGFQETAEAEGKWIRAQLTSCQLSTYFTGTLEMWKLRKDYEQLKGRDFNLAEFHESVLSFGSIPIHYIRKEMLGE